MAVTHPTTIRNLVADTVVDSLEDGSTFGLLDFRASASTSVVVLTFDSTAFGAASGGTATANSITDGTASTAGTVTVAVGLASCSTEVFRCSVTSTGGGGDIELSSNVISSGQTVSITSLTYSAMS